MSWFRNPYHFIPVDFDGQPPDAVPLGDFAQSQERRQAPHLTHDRFVKKTHSGRFVCKLTVETPLICANEQEEREGRTKLLRPFELTANEPALPGSALRGMLSTLVEAASRSALRVLQNRHMSYRRQVGEGLSAIGMIVAKADGSLHLLPLASPHEDHLKGRALPQGDGANYATMFPHRRPKVYFGGANVIGTPAFLLRYKTNLLPTGGPLYALHQTWVADKVKNDRFWLGERIQPPPPGNAERNVRVWEELTEEERCSGEWIRGVLRVLGKYPQRASALPTKKNEFFLRFSEYDEKRLTDGEGVFPIDAEAIARFNHLADERAEVENTPRTASEELLPYTPHGAARQSPVESGRPSSSWYLKAGDIVFFRPSDSGESVVEVSLSSVWRGRVEQHSPNLSRAAPLWSFLGPELIPFVSRRTRLTLAEQLFGAVEAREDGQKEGKAGPTFAFASRLRVSNAVLHGAPEGGPYQAVKELLSASQSGAQGGRETEFPLKNLASPKPPSSSLYFKNRTDPAAYIPKNRLNPKKHAPQGVKLYVRRANDTYQASTEAFVHHERLSDTDGRAAITRQHQSVEKFVRPGSTFYFHIDFDNLNDLELQLLAYVLKPTTAFRHQVGHGKPLGLGQVEISIVGLLEIIREARYRDDDLTANRWHKAWVSGEPKEWPKSLTRHGPHDFAPLAGKLDELKGGLEKWGSAHGLSSVLRALELLGAAPADDVPVHYPQVELVDTESSEFDEEHYRWFVQNDRAQGGQFLRPLVDAYGRVASALPVLDRQRQAAPPQTDYAGPRTEAVGVETRQHGPAMVPQSLEGREVEARAGLPDQKGRVQFTLSCQGVPVPEVHAHVHVRRDERARFAAKYVEGTVVRAKVVRAEHDGYLIQILDEKSA